jgi:hypothetical protein
MMMMTTLLPPPALVGRSLGDEVRVRVENLKTVSLNFLKSGVQDTHTFKLGSALIASFTLVLARVYVATRSANKEAEATGADSDSTAFCKDQALMTTVREIGGFATSWLFMSVFNVVMDKPSQLLFGVRLNKYGVTGPITYLSKLAQQLVPFGNRVLEEALPKAVGCRRTLHILGEASTFTAQNASQLETYFSTLQPNKVQLFFRKGLELLVNQPQLKKDLAIEAFQRALPATLSPTEKAQAVLGVTPRQLEVYESKLDPDLYRTRVIKHGFTNFSTYVIPVVGAGISTVVAGWMLERATLLHFPEIIDKINQLRVKKQQPMADVETIPSVSTSSSLNAVASPSYLSQAVAVDSPLIDLALTPLKQRAMVISSLSPLRKPALW